MSSSTQDPSARSKQPVSKKTSKLNTRAITNLIILSLMLAIAWVAKCDRPANYIPKNDWMIEPETFKTTFSENAADATIQLENGLIRRVWKIAPNAATVSFDNLMTGETLLRSVRPEAEITFDEIPVAIGGLSGQPNHAYLTPEWIDTMRSWPCSFQFTYFEQGIPEERMAWKRVRHHAPNATWPPEGRSLKMHYKAPDQLEDGNPTPDWMKELSVTVHYEMYDGIPAMSKWITVKNIGSTPHDVDRFQAEILAIVPYEDPVEYREGVSIQPPNLHVETDYAFGGFTIKNSTRFSVHWQPDPMFDTQVNYLKQNPCLLKMGPQMGPDQTIVPGSTFESFRCFIMPFDTTERYRKGLAVRKMYRTIAPWVTENPLILHLTTSDNDKVKTAIDQAAECGFEIVNLSFGSGLNMENNDPEYLARFKSLTDYARSKGIEMGGYSLLSSRRIQPDTDNCIHPETGKPGGQTHGFCPALASEWGQNYFQKLRTFFEQTGFTKFVHDGSYPGDLDASSRPPFQKGVSDSRWVQWKMISSFYQWMRGNGYYLRVPDYYYLSGANEAGMGYREVNWSLPRVQQQIHTRQNIFDGSIQKTPSMGWMFVPLTQYHGGGDAATIEPLNKHLPHYETMLASNLGAGVQAVYRGHRLFDTDQTRDRVKHWVDWYKTYRDILESDIIHTSSRRPDGQQPDWIFHANPTLENQGIWIGFNPLSKTITEQLTLNLYYTGITETAIILPEGNQEQAIELKIDAFNRIHLPITWNPNQTRWFIVKKH
jgi:hypothetical protein